MRSLPFELEVMTPCQQQWSDLSGRGAERHCTLCDCTVYNLEALTWWQIEALLVETNGKLCGRVRYVDGSPAYKATLWRGGTLAFVALTSITGLANRADAQASSDFHQVSGQDPASVPVQGRITDASGALVVGALVTLRPASGAVISTTTTAEGEFSVAVPRGEYRVEVNALSFALYSARLAVSSEQTDEVMIALKPGATESIEVTSQRMDGSSTVGAMISSISYGPWYKRIGLRLRHPIAYTRYALRHR